MIFMLPTKIEIKIQLFRFLVLELDVFSCWNTQSGPVGGNSAGSPWVVGDWETWECFLVQYITNVVSKNLFLHHCIGVGDVSMESVVVMPLSYFGCLHACVCEFAALCRCCHVPCLRRRLLGFQVFAKSKRVSSFQLCVAAKMCRAGTRVTQQLNAIG